MDIRKFFSPKSNSTKPEVPQVKKKSQYDHDNDDDFEDHTVVAVGKTAEAALKKGNAAKKDGKDKSPAKKDTKKDTKKDEGKTTKKAGAVKEEAKKSDNAKKPTKKEDNSTKSKESTKEAPKRKRSPSPEPPTTKKSKPSPKADDKVEPYTSKLRTPPKQEEQLKNKKSPKGQPEKEERPQPRVSPRNKDAPTKTPPPKKDEDVEMVDAEEVQKPKKSTPSKTPPKLKTPPPKASQTPPTKASQTPPSKTSQTPPKKSQTPPTSKSQTPPTKKADEKKLVKKTPTFDDESTEEEKETPKKQVKKPIEAPKKAVAKPSPKQTPPKKEAPKRPPPPSHDDESTEEEAPPVKKATGKRVQEDDESSSDETPRKPPLTKEVPKKRYNSEMDNEDWIADSDDDDEIPEPVDPPKAKQRVETPTKRSPKKQSPKKPKLEITRNPSAVAVKTVVDPNKKVVKGEPKEDEEEAKETPVKKKPTWFMYAQRPPPPNKGTKELPTGNPDCLAGKIFMVTGVLDSLERDEAFDLIRSYGGAVAKSVTKKLTHAVVGSDFGEKKMEQLKEKKIPVLTEDDLFEMIRTLPTPKIKPSPQKPKRASPKKAAAPAPSVAPLPPSGAPLLWVDKYKPQARTDLVGNPGVVTKLSDWLKNWKNRKGKGGSSANDSAKNAVLLSGGPGIGKSTAATVLARECGYEPVEFNASDTRSKKSLEAEVAEITGSRSINEFFTGDSKKAAPKRSVCLIMDEVDGIAGAEDRSGITELISIIKTTKVPIICICNERSSPKLKSLINYCYDLKYTKITPQQAKTRLSAICAKEGFKINDLAIEKVVEQTNGDMRQALNVLHMWSLSPTTAGSGPVDHITAIKRMTQAGKDVLMTPFTAAERLFSGACGPRNPQRRPGFDDMEQVAKAADCISDGDLVDHAVSWLGKNSSTNKRRRLVRELQSHMRTSTSADTTQVGLEFLPLLKQRLVKPIIQQGKEGIDEVLEFMEEYGLTREDWDSVIELADLRGNGKDELDSIPRDVKTAFTKAYNARNTMVTAPSRAGSGSNKLTTDVFEDDVADGNASDGIADDDEEGEKEEEEDIKADKLIKAKPAKKAAASSAAGKKGKAGKGEASKAKEKKPKAKKAPKKK